jgi:hypothetical protein
MPYHMVAVAWSDMTSLLRSECTRLVKHTQQRGRLMHSHHRNVGSVPQLADQVHMGVTYFGVSTSLPSWHLEPLLGVINLMMQPDFQVRLAQGVSRS